MDHDTDRPYPAAGTTRAPLRARRIRNAVLAAALLATGVALTACGGGGGDSDGAKKASDGGVASLETPAANGEKTGAPSAQSSAAAVEAKRPQLRLDSSKEEIDRLWDAYHACLQAHGVPMNTERARLAGAKQAWPVDDPKITAQYKAEYDACLYKMPLQPVEERPETNPHYADDYRDWVKCLRAKGAKVHETFDSDGMPSGATYDDASKGVGTPLTEKLENDCRLEAFGGKGKN